MSECQYMTRYLNPQLLLPVAWPKGINFLFPVKPRQEAQVVSVTLCVAMDSHPVRGTFFLQFAVSFFRIEYMCIYMIWYDIWYMPSILMLLPQSPANFYSLLKWEPKIYSLDSQELTRSPGWLCNIDNQMPALRKVLALENPWPSSSDEWQPILLEGMSFKLGLSLEKSRAILHLRHWL